MPALNRVSAWLDERLIEKDSPTDDRLPVKKTALIAQCGSSLFLVLAAYNASGAGSGEASWAAFVVLWCCIVCNASATGSMFWTRRFAPVQVSCWLVPLGTLCLFGDWVTLGTTDVWTLVVLVMDGMLAFGAHPGSARFFLFLTVFYLVLRSSQESKDWGFWSPVEDYAGRYVPYLCPTKDTGLGVSTLLFRVLVFNLDYTITRGFANTMVSQYEAMKVSQSVTETLAVLLSRYEVESAQRVVDGYQGDDLPPPLRAAFCQLLVNLESYKPFLPQHCLPDEKSEESPVTQYTGSNLNSPKASAARESTSNSTLPGRMASIGVDEMHHSTGGADKRSSRGSTASAVLAMSVSRIRRTSAGHVAIPSGTGGAVKAAPGWEKVTLLRTNRRGFLTMIHRGSAAVQAVLQQDIDRFAHCINMHRGVAENLSGDHLHASFNAARNCAMHRVAAVRAVTAFAQSDRSLPERHRVTSAVCSGQALRGDFGSSAIMRFMIIGGVSNLLTPVERLANSWGATVLVDASTYGDLAQTWSCRLRCAAVFPKLGSDQEFFLWQVYGEREAGITDPAEWMYELAGVREDPWRQHAMATRLWLAEQQSKAAVAAAEALAAAAEEGDSAAVLVHSALEQLVKDLEAGVPPPRLLLSEGGGVAVGAARDQLIDGSLSSSPRPSRGGLTPPGGSPAADCQCVSPAHTLSFCSLPRAPA